MAKTKKHNARKKKGKKQGSKTVPVENCQVFETFEAMHLKGDLLEGINNYGYVKPSAVQQLTIVPLCGECDVFGQVAESEPGKISAICIGILQKLDCNNPKCQAVVFTDSIVSSQEIGKAMEQLGASLKVNVYMFGRGSGDCPDDVQVVVGPSSFVMSKWSSSWNEHLKVVFFDKPEWMGRNEFSYLFQRLLPARENYQVGSFSEKESAEVYSFVRDWMKNPVIIRVPCKLEVEDGRRRHQVISVKDQKSKPEELIRLYNISTKKTSVIFVNTTKRVEELAEEMRGQDSVNVLLTKAGMNQKIRDDKMQELYQPEGRPRVLITTEEWANGIDLKKVELLVNYDLPISGPWKYLRRMQRVGREADSVNFITGDDWWMLFDIQEHYKNEVVFEGYPLLQPFQVGHAGFSREPLLEGLKISEERLLPGINHYLFNVIEAEAKAKPSLIWRNLKEDLAKVKVVIFAKVDHSKELENKGIKVFAMDNLAGFFKCRKDHCVLIITDDKHALNDSHPKVPVVINCDLPCTQEMYNHRVAWCGKDGVAIHCIGGDDWLKVFHFGSSGIGWLSPGADFAGMIQRASNNVRSDYDTYDWNAKLDKSSLEPTKGNLGVSGLEVNARRPIHEEHPGLEDAHPCGAPK